MASSKWDAGDSEDDLPKVEGKLPEDTESQEESDRGKPSRWVWLRLIGEGLLVLKLILELIDGNGG